ncbi:MAG: hypothetical protein K1X55_10425 [Chitinophagales bacterium]|nr:hypothetical protein [Chitinophagales bacterium]
MDSLDLSQNNKYTIQLIFTTLPANSPEKFNKEIYKDYFENYRKQSYKYFKNKNKSEHFYYNNNKKIPIIYNPLKYYILGSYDIVFINLIDNLKFALRLFEPKSKQFTHYSQNLIGITYHKGNIKEFFYKKLSKADRKYFLGITSFKLNNGLLIGNGVDFLDEVAFKIEEEIVNFNKIENNSDKIDFQLIQSFSWHELTLVLFCDNPESVYEIVRNIRRIELKDLENWNQMLDLSYLKNVFNATQNKNFSRINVFSDSQTQIGLHADLVETEDDDEFYNRFKRNNKIKLNTEIEWQVKPGHLKFLKDLFSKNNVGFDLDAIYIISGKLDYYIQESDRLEKNNNLALFRLIYRKGNDIFKHVRKICTRIYFKVETSTDMKNVISLEKKLDEFSFVSSLNEIEKYLKELKISRVLKTKLVKMFASYNNGIVDPILFHFFIDFQGFLKTVRDEIINNKNQQISQIKDLEKQFTEFINIYNDAYYIRMLNSYQYEDLNVDLNLDFNTSLQQLISSYGVLARDIGKLFWAYNNYAPIIQVDLIETKANPFSINYNINHIVCPEFIYSTLSKEIINYLSLVDTKFSKIILKLEGILPNDSKINSWKKSNYIQYDRFIIDIIRWYFPYMNDLKLFNFWFWTYNFQNSLMYETSGHISEKHLEKEMVRYYFYNSFIKILEESKSKNTSELKEFFLLNPIKLECPIPEIFVFWERHQKFVSEGVVNLITNLLLEDGLFANIKEFVEEFFNIDDAGNKDNLEYKYLSWFYGKCNGQISLLRRNWDDGQPINDFISYTDKKVFVDQFGGWFFTDTETLEDYFVKTNENLLAIWNYSMLNKIKFQ